jgi:hypothetical protein
MTVRSFLAVAVALLASGASAGTLSSATWTTELPPFIAGGATLAVAVPVSASGTSASASIAVSLTLPRSRPASSAPAAPSKRIEP